MTQEDARKCIATYNDKIDFYCGRTPIDPNNSSWIEFICDPSFEARLFLDCIVEFFDGGGVYDRESFALRLRAVYWRRKKENRPDQPSRCACLGHRQVFILVDRQDNVVDFRNAPLKDIERAWATGGVVLCQCPFCQRMNAADRAIVRKAYMPVTVRQGSNFFPPGWDKPCSYGGNEIIYEWIKYRIGNEKR